MPCTSIYYFVASSTTNYTRTHARTLYTHATRSLTRYRSISSKQQCNQFNRYPIAPKIKERRRAMEEEKGIQCMSIHYFLASSITNYTRAHARTPCIANTQIPYPRQHI